MYVSTYVLPYFVILNRDALTKCMYVSVFNSW